MIGTATGWDQADTFVIQLYDFVPAENTDLPWTDCLSIDFESGKAETYDDEGKPLLSRDLLSSIKHLPVKESK
jgi:hypothetical protein